MPHRLGSGPKEGTRGYESQNERPESQPERTDLIDSLVIRPQGFEKSEGI